MSEEQLSNIPVEQIEAAEIGGILENPQSPYERAELAEDGYGRAVILWEEAEDQYQCFFGQELVEVAADEGLATVPAIVKDERETAERISAVMAHVIGSRDPVTYLMRIYELQEVGWMDWEELKQFFQENEIEIVKELVESGEEYEDELEERKEELDSEEKPADMHYLETDDVKHRSITLKLSLTTYALFERVLEETPGEDVDETVDKLSRIVLDAHGVPPEEVLE